MDKNSYPLDTLIDFALVAGADVFWVNNAKDELKRLRSKFTIDPVAWARINNEGDIYDLRLQNNPYIDQSKIIPLYRSN